jgi:hypothetical protein
MISNLTEKIFKKFFEFRPIGGTKHFCDFQMAITWPKVLGCSKFLHFRNQLVKTLRLVYNLTEKQKKFLRGSGGYKVHKYRELYIKGGMKDGQRTL